VCDLKKSGIDKYLLQVLSVAREEGIVLDFLTSQYSKEAECFLHQKGSRLYTVHSLKKPHLHYRDVKQILSSGEYTGAYFNVSEPLNLMGAKAAHDLSLPCSVHSHASNMDVSSFPQRWVRGAINCLCRPMIRSYTDRFYTCSSKAAEWLFGKEFSSSERCRVIYNAVDETRFYPCEEKRRVVRKELGFSEKDFVIGHVGSYCYQKNNFFLPKILEEAVKDCPNAKMLLVGDGADRPAVEEDFFRRGLSQNVLFLGVRTDVSELFRAMDVFVLPSRFEGLPIVAVEAQLSGVPCLLSDRIDPLVCLSSRSELLSLSDPSLWAREALRFEGLDQNEASYTNISLFSAHKNRAQLVQLVMDL